MASLGLWFAGPGARALAQPVSPEMDRLLAEVESLERRAADGVLTLPEREQAADRAMERRARLIDAAGQDPRRISWMIDQASAVLARLSRDASDTSAIYGVPTGEQRAQVAGAAAEAAAFLDQARQAAAGITERETRLSLREGDEGNALLAAVRDEQVRGAFVRGRAEVLLAEAAEGNDGQGHAQAAIDALGGIMMEEPAAEAARRANLAAALLARGEEGDARAAMTNFDFAAGEQRMGRPGALPGTTAEALLGRLHASSGAEFDACLRDLVKTRDRAPRTVRGRPDPVWHLIFADAIGRACITKHRLTGDRGLLERAFEAHRAILEGRPDLGLSAEERRTIVWARMDALVRLIGDPVTRDGVPAIAIMAHGVALAREPGTAAEAERLFLFLAQSPEAGVAADALWEACVLTERRGDPAGAAALTARFAREHPRDRRAPDAIAHALHHAGTAFQRASGEQRRAARSAYVESLRLATASFGASGQADRWRIDLARLLIEEPGERVHDEALALLEGVAPGSPRATEADSLYEEVQGARLETLRAAIVGARRAGEQDEVRRLGRSLAVEARRAAAWAGGRSRPSLERFLADRAEGQVETGQPDDAAGVYRDLLGRSGGTIPGGAARLRLGLGRALLLSGDAAGGFAALREVVTPFDALASGEQRPEEYWHAWTLMLEVLAEREGRDAPAVRVQVRRLGTVDPELGGPPWRERIRALVKEPG